jgi:8-oxo-dGTP diphosphatase
MGSKQQGADATDGRWLTIPRTLCFVLNGDDVLLMKRAADKRVFPNCFNGVGGHIERNEDPYTSARREILEETGLNVRELQLRAVYNIDAGAGTGVVLFVFTCFSQSRQLQSDEREGSLHWVPRHEVMNLDLVEDLPMILPRLFTDDNQMSPLFVHVSYDEQDDMQMRFANDG